ncbi:MAG TPA: hypothetical protein PLQ27_00610 [Candidatus Paceibacterota bacterium]|nr:hypothetical protein [Candidatus Paceibacterota bacterium]
MKKIILFILFCGIIIFIGELTINYFPRTLVIEPIVQNHSSFTESYHPQLLIEDTNIDKFVMDPSKNKLIYFSDNQWGLFERKTEKIKTIYQSKQRPLTINFPPDNSINSQEVLVNLNNDWKIIFLNQTMITKELSLTKSFLKVFQESNIKNLEDKPAILQAQYHPFLKNNFLIRTNNNIVLYDFLKNQLDLIYHGPTSPFFIGNNNLYFLEQNGALVLYSLQEQKEINHSLFSFYQQDINKIKIFIPESNSLNHYLIVVDDYGRAYFFQQIDDSSPALIGEEISNVFIFKDKVFLINSIISPNEELSAEKSEENNFQIIIFDPLSGQTQTLHLIMSSENCFLLKDRFLVFLNNQKKLSLFDLENQTEKEIIDEPVKNDNFVLDNSLNYLYYLTKKGINRINL